MYNELLPFWKARCQSVKAVGAGTGWVTELNRRGIYHPSQVDRLQEGTKSFDWVENESGKYDCLVLGVMLFTWETGLEP